MRKRRVYVETSVWNFLFADDAPYRKEAAEILVSRGDLYELFISPAVTREIGNCPGDFGVTLRDKVYGINPMNLKAHAEAERLSEEYVKRGIIPVKYSDDAVHIAYASFYEMDYLASYNFQHIVKVKTRNMVGLVNNLMGYATPEIIAPEELVDYDW